MRQQIISMMIINFCFALCVVYNAGPSVLDVFKMLVKQLTSSIEMEQSVHSQEGIGEDSLRFQDSLTKTMGEFAGVLPDYQKPDIMTLINTYMPTVDEATGVEVVAGSQATTTAQAGGGHQIELEHPLSDRYYIGWNEKNNGKKKLK